MEKCAKVVLSFAFIVAGCSSSGSNPADAGNSPEGGSGGWCASPGTPKAPRVVDGHFDNGVFSGFAHTWLKNATSASHVVLACQAGASCAGGSELCAHVVIEGASENMRVPSFLDPSVAAPQVGFGLNINQGPDRSSLPTAWSPRGDGLYVSFSSPSSEWFIVQITAEDGARAGLSERWCAFPATSAAPDLTMPWSGFRKCDGSGQGTYLPTHPISAIDFYVEPSGMAAAELDLCVRDVVPYGLPSETISCVDWYRHPIPGTHHVLINNVWNAQLAGTSPHKQCLLKRCTGDGEEYGWTWDWPAVVMDSSFAAPEVVFGRKPWDGGGSTTPDLPKRVDGIRSLTLDYGVQIMAGQSYNLNATMWLTRTEAASVDPDPQNIVAEVMVRFNNPLGMGGGNVDDGMVTLDGIPFHVTHQDAHADASGGSRYTWKMVVYETSSPSLSGQFDLALVLGDMLAKNLVKAENGVQGVELITEVAGDKGEVWLRRFGVSVK